MRQRSGMSPRSRRVRVECGEAGRVAPLHTARLPALTARLARPRVSGHGRPCSVLPVGHRDRAGRERRTPLADALLRVEQRSARERAASRCTAQGRPRPRPRGDSVRVVVGDGRRGAKVGGATRHHWTRDIARPDSSPGPDRPWRRTRRPTNAIPTTGSPSWGCFSMSWSSPESSFCSTSRRSTIAWASVRKCPLNAHRELEHCPRVPAPTLRYVT